MSQQADYLRKHGWEIAVTRVRGMVKIVKWKHPKIAGGSMAQCDAYNFERARQKNKERGKENVTAHSASGN